MLQVLDCKIVFMFNCICTSQGQFGGGREVGVKGPDQGAVRGDQA